MRRDNDGSFIGNFLIDQPQDNRAGRHIEARHWLIEEKYLCFLSETLCYENTLALSARKIVQLGRSEVTDRQSLESVVDGISILGAEPSKQTNSWVAGKRNGVAHRDRQTPVDIGRLKDERWCAAADGGFPAGCSDGASKYTQQRRFP